MAKRKVWLEPFEIPYDVFENIELRELSITLMEFDLSAHETLKPGYLQKLTKLKKLDLTGIWISEDIFKNEICNLVHLEDLTLMYSNIDHIPDAIINLKKLKKICFRANNIKEFPASFFKLPNLTSLNCINNKFESIPKELFEMKTLEEITFWGNKIN
jgi:Leucine-rich repeat (LRR) protein